MAMQSGFIKRIRDIMRMDAGINGDAQRIEQMVWMLFLKVYDAKEDDWELNEDNYESIIPEDLRWRNWAKADGSALWEQERTTLIKKECHKYDEEWRMITGCIMKPPVMMEWIPSGIILGLRMDVAEENLVVSMAKEAGIKNIYKSYINAQNKLDAYPLKL